MSFWCSAARCVFFFQRNKLSAIMTMKRTLHPTETLIMNGTLDNTDRLEAGFGVGSDVVVAVDVDVIVCVDVCVDVVVVVGRNTLAQDSTGHIPK